MRENIGLFKAKEVIYKTSVEGSLIKTNCGGLNPNEFHNIPNECIFVENECNCYYQIQEEYYPFLIHNIDPETICEFIGLKDKHGNKIWENDVIKLTVEVQGYNSFGEPNDDYSFFGHFIGYVKHIPSYGFHLQSQKKVDDITGEEFASSVRKNIVSYRSEVTGNRFD